MCKNRIDSLKMFPILGLKILSSSRRVVASSSIHNLGFRPNALLSFKFLSEVSFRTSEDKGTNSFIVTYLVNSCSIPLETALDVASKVNFRTPKNPDFVISLLRNQGFTETQISSIVRQYPSLLFYSSDRTLLPKFDFLHSIGFSKSECVYLVHSSPVILKRSLKNHLIPSHNYLKSLLVQDEKVVKCLKRSPRAFLEDLQDKLAPNIALLRISGVSEVWISSLVTNYLCSASLKHSKFRSIVNQVRAMGFDPLKRSFVEVISVLSRMTPSTLEGKFEAYGKYGWSKDQTLLAFKKFPQCLMLSEENIFKTMDFFVHKMGLKPDVIASKPLLMGFSLEKRIIPRWYVVQSLCTKGLLKKKSSIISFLYLPEKIFLERYVTKFPKDVTGLLHLYAGNVKA